MNSLPYHHHPQFSQPLLTSSSLSSNPLKQSLTKPLLATLKTTPKPTCFSNLKSNRYLSEVAPLTSRHSEQAHQVNSLSNPVQGLPKK